jgi:Trypsin-like peptidase domain
VSQEQFLRHFESCTVAVLRDASVVGTGFFAAPGLIITCAHVVEAPGDSIAVRWNKDVLKASIDNVNNPRSMAEVQPRGSADPDLALLRVEYRQDAIPPSVLFDEVTPRLSDPLYSFGHPEGPYSENGESLQLTYEGPAYDSAGRSILKLREGNVRPGMSGAPVLSRRSGGVSGVLFASRDIHTDLGGRALPTSLIFSTFPGIREQNDLCHTSNHDWANLWSEEEGAVLLFDFPRGPAVDRKTVGIALIRATAQLYPTPIKAQAILREANRLRAQADPKGGMIDEASLPPPTVAPLDYWFIAFTEACLQGPRMLGALLLVMDDWQFSQGLQRERRDILDYLRHL